MRYSIKNVTLNISNDQSGDSTGDCNCSIPFSHKRFFTESCGMSRYDKFTNSGYDPIFEHDYGNIYISSNKDSYYTDSPDIIIMYLAWLFEEDGNHEVEVNYNNPFWAIHDVQHALFDESGCTIYVDADIEEQRLIDTFNLFKKEGYTIDYETVQEVAEAYNQRFGKNISFEEYLEYEYEEDL